MRTVSGVEVLWHNDWFDGPLEGVAVYDGNEYYFRVEDSRGAGVARSKSAPGR